MEQMRILTPEAREIFGDSESENGDDFADFLPEYIEGHPATHVPGAGAGPAPAYGNDDNSTRDPDSDDDSEMGPEDTTFADALAYDCWWLRVFNRPVGPANIPPATDDYGLFRLFFSDELVTDIVTETNRYSDEDGPATELKE